MKILTLLIIDLLFATSAFGENIFSNQVILKNGTVIKGVKAISTSSEIVVLYPNGKSVLYNKNKVKDIGQDLSTPVDNSQVIITLNGEKFTTKRFEQAYQTAMESTCRIQNLDKKTVLEIVSKNNDELEESLRPINYQLQKRNFYDNYRNMSMIKLVAEKAGFTSRKDIRNILDYNEMMTIAQLYIHDEFEKKVKLTDKDVQQGCQNLRDSEPRYQELSEEKCFQAARVKQKQTKSERVLPKILENIKEIISIKHNDKFDLDDYLKK